MSNTVKTFVAEKNVRNTTANEKTKDVYKHVLDSPFLLQFPKVTPETSGDLVKNTTIELLKVFGPIGQYRKKRRTLKKEKKGKETLNKPDLLSRLYVGINEVTKCLENFIENKRLKKDQDLQNFTPVIYICKREFKPPTLCNHLLYMAALADIKLLVLNLNAEVEVGQALGLNRASVVLLKIMEDKEEKLRLFAQDIPPIDAPWLKDALTQPPHFIKENIKIVKTVGPVLKKNQQQQKNSQQQKNNKQQTNNDPKKRKAEEQKNNGNNKKSKK